MIIRNKLRYHPGSASDYRNYIGLKMPVNVDLFPVVYVLRTEKSNYFSVKLGEERDCSQSTFR